MDDFYHRLLHHEATKDVDIEMSDGTLRAHSCLLCVASEAIQGMLSHGAAATCKKLSWREHPIAVGRLLLGLLYTGGVAAEDWSQDGGSLDGSWDCTNSEGRWKAQVTITGTRVKYDNSLMAEIVATGLNTFSYVEKGATLTCTLDANKQKLAWSDGDIWTRLESEVPLHLLLGCLSLSKMYQISQVLHSTIEALKTRLNDDTFDDICRAAIKDDVTALRFDCLQYVQAPGARAIAPGLCVETLEPTEYQGRVVQAGSLANVIRVGGKLWISYVVGQHIFVQVGTHEDNLKVVSKVKAMFLRQGLSPEVMFELVMVWGPPSSAPKRRKIA